MGMEFYIKSSDIHKITNPSPQDRLRHYTVFEVMDTVITRCSKCRWYDKVEHMCYYHSKPMKENDYCSRGRRFDDDV